MNYQGFFVTFSFSLYYKSCMKQLLLFVLALFCNYWVNSQTKTLDTVFCDCEQARIVTINGKTTTPKTIAPMGAGEVNEISHAKQKTKYAFDKEHHSAWYKILVKTNGNLTFDVKPVKQEDDYDFMLFRTNPTGFCDSLQKHRINPIRACISRDKEELQGKTGLSYNAKDDFVKHGVGAAYCSPIQVKKGECYYLVLDNVYENGEGHSIEFSISVLATIAGVIVDENKKPIKAEITLTNVKGDTIAIEKTKDDGSYRFSAQMIKNQDYSLNLYNDSSFTLTKIISTADTSLLKSLKSVLPKLKKGKKYSVGAINFHPASATYLPQALPAMNNLHRLMKKNQSLKIQIIGHSNGRDFNSSEAAIIKFTKDRATTVKNYLVLKGIDEKRIEIDGKGDHQMLYHLPGATEAQQVENRRVEIMVLEY